MATTAARARHGSYIFQRPDSANWYIQLRSPGAKRFEKSLGTADKLEAQAKAAPMVAEHKARLLAARPRFEASWAHRLEPGREHAGEDGGKIVATDRELIHIGHNGAILKIEPNGGPANRLVNMPFGAVLVGDGPTTRPLAELRRIGPVINLDALARPTVAKKNADDTIIETYLQHANVTGYYESEARAVWAVFKSLTNGVALKDATRDDGRKVVAHFQAQGAKSATISKKVGWLSAACNLAIKEGRLKFNPFSSIVPKCDDADRRLPLDDADMKACKRNLGKLSEADQLLFRILATTGMRLSEAFQIDREQPKEKGLRFVIIGEKTDQSLRRVPLPADLLPHLPSTIKGQLFPLLSPSARQTAIKRTSDAASKRLMRFLRKECGVGDPNKVIHSLRHRAQDRLRAAGCPQDVRWAILGHEDPTVAASYGEGFPVTLLRKWVDKINF
jgi:integrase